MTNEQLRSTRDANPFQPFTIQMTNDRSYRIPHRDFLAIMPNGRTATIWHTNEDACSIVDIMLVTKLTMDAIPAPASANPPKPNPNN